MAIFGLIVAHAAPQQRQEIDDSILPADTSEEPLPQGGPDGKPIRKCTWKDFPADKLRSGEGGKHDDYYKKLALICQTNEPTNTDTHTRKTMVLRFQNEDYH